jgi:hypothetical protein
MAAPGEGDRSLRSSVEPVVAVGLEHGAAEGADDRAPGAAVHGEEVAQPGGRLHARHAGAPAAPRADPRRRLAAPHRPPLVHQEAEEHHPGELSAFSMLFSKDVYVSASWP